MTIATHAGGLFVTGTDTEVGKTIVSALICARYKDEVPLAYWKPIASGSVEGRDVLTVGELSGADTIDEHILLEEPLSPHLAARLENQVIDPAEIVRQLRRHLEGERALVVEGVGGLHVPLTDDGVLLSDIMPRFGLPAVVVARSTLGTINHTLLTLEALRHRRIDIAGVVLDGPPNPENRRAIREFGDVEILGQLPPCEPLDRAAISTWARTFDTAGRLRRWLDRPAA